MKIHFGRTSLPWHLAAKLPSLYWKGGEYTTYRKGHVRRAFGISTGSRFIGFVIAGPFVHEDARVPTRPAGRGALEEQP